MAEWWDDTSGLASLFEGDTLGDLSEWGELGGDTFDYGGDLGDLGGIDFGSLLDTGLDTGGFDLASDVGDLGGLLDDSGAITADIPSLISEGGLTLGTAGQDAAGNLTLSDMPQDAGNVLLTPDGKPVDPGTAYTLGVPGIDGQPIPESRYAFDEEGASVSSPPGLGADGKPITGPSLPKGWGEGTKWTDPSGAGTGLGTPVKDVAKALANKLSGGGDGTNNLFDIDPIPSKTPSIYAPVGIEAIPQSSPAAFQAMGFPNALVPVPQTSGLQRLLDFPQSRAALLRGGPQGAGAS